jgi:hypothetical protein
MRDKSEIFVEVAQEIVDIDRLGGAVWPVYEEYEIVGEPGALYVEGRGRHETYRPLNEQATLFAKFARLNIPGDEAGQAEVVRGWARKYGVLGLEPVDTAALRIGGKSLRVDSTTGDGLESYPQGSHSRDSVARFVGEAHAAKAALAFYEAARKADDGALRLLATLDPYDEFYPPGVPFDAPDTVEARKWGLHAVAMLTQGRVSAWCSPAIFWRGGSPAGDWAFKNLAGAMWLQMFFALTGDHTGRMCANPDCPNPDFPMHRTARPDGKKDTGPRRKYCSVDCRMHAHYVNKTKPRRRQARAAK